MKRFFAALLFSALTTLPLQAQTENFWIQIEARPTLSAAQDRAREYAQRLQNVEGYYLGTGFYAMAIGPFTRAEADATRRQLLRSRAIPADSFVKNGNSFRQQFWPPDGENIISTSSLPAAVPAPPPPPPPPDETPQQARASERALSFEDRALLQTALQWAGVYTAAIDGSFGRGTRAAMQDWQVLKGYEATGILTTAQRAALIADYNSVLDGLALRRVRDAASGIEIELPTAVVAFSDYQPPFARFEASGAIPEATVLLISQPGDRGTLAGLYEILQILALVPPEGPRNLSATGFEIIGSDALIHSQTTVTLQDNQIKGFMLVWPAGDDARRTRVHEIMQASFTRLDGVLDPQLQPPGEDQSIDMVSGLQIRQPQQVHTGFFVAPDGTVATIPQAVENCSSITVNRDTTAEIILSDTDLGIALLRPVQPITPRATVTFDTDVPRLRDRIALAGYPFDGALNAPTLNYGEIVDIRNLSGDDRFLRINAEIAASEAGAPVFDANGSVRGMVIARADSAGRVLPNDVNFALDAGQITALLAAQGITAATAPGADRLTPQALTRAAADNTVLVSCW